MGRISNSMALLKTSWGVLTRDKQLAVIPVVSAVCTAVVMALMGVGVFATIRQTTVNPTARNVSPFADTASGTNYQPTAFTWVVVVLGFVLLSIVVTYFTAALVAGAHQRLTGGDPTLGSAFGAATGRLPQLIGWALINATVGAVLRAIAERGGILGQIVASMADFAWNIVSWMAVPFIVVEGVGPFDALKRSAAVLKKTWGENLTANIGFGLVNFLLVLGALGIGALFFAVGLWPVGIVVALVLVAIGSVIMSALTGIYRTALFLYAATGTVPEAFDPQLLQGAFRHKKLGIL